MPASGKSTLGRLVAAKTDRQFLDIDTLVTDRDGRRPAEIVVKDGAKAFAELEAQVALELHVNDTIIATGGSLVLSPAAIEHLRNISTVVFLEVSLEELIRRVPDLDARGVVREQGEELADVYRRRASLYRRYADLTVSTEIWNPERLTERLIKVLKEPICRGDSV